VTEARIVVVTPDAGFEQRVRLVSGALNGAVQRWAGPGGRVSPAALIEWLAPRSPDVVALGPGLDVDQALDLAAHLERARPEVSVLLVTRPAAELWERALSAGVRDILDPTSDDPAFAAKLGRVLEVAEVRRHNLAAASTSATASGRIIMTLSPKGGSGKTTITSNLAAAIASLHRDEVVAVDLDTQFGDLATALALEPEHHLLDAARMGGDLDAMTLKTYLTPHPSGLWVMCGPESPAEGELIGPWDARDVVVALAQEFPYVLIDTCAGLNEHTLAVMEVSTDLLLLCSMDVSSIRGLRKEVEVLEQLGLTAARRLLVVNRADADVGIDIRDVATAIGQPVDAQIPSSRLIPLAMNQGKPIVESDPRSAVAQRFMSLARAIDGLEEPNPRARSLRWFQR
jgi:pilus assembly protein CpaE